MLLFFFFKVVVYLCFYGNSSPVWVALILINIISFTISPNFCVMCKNRFFNICDRNCPIYLETKHTCVNVVVFTVRKEPTISNSFVQYILQLQKCNVLTESHWIGDFTKCLHRKKRFWCNSYQKERLRRRKTYLHFVPFLTSYVHAHKHKHKTQRQRHKDKVEKSIHTPFPWLPTWIGSGTCTNTSLRPTATLLTRQPFFAQTKRCRTTQFCNVFPLY